MKNILFLQYFELQADRILSGDRTSEAKCFAIKEDVPNVQDVMQIAFDKGVFVRFEKSKVLLPYEEEIYCFIISKGASK